MKLIVCVENSGGMLFNNRRLSRDSKVTEDILSCCKDRLFFTDFSSSLFNGDGKTVSSPEAVPREGYFFIENILPSSLLEMTEGIVIYRWNRDYPHDLSFDIDLSEFTMAAPASEISGTSHEKITKEEYSR